MSRKVTVVVDFLCNVASGKSRGDQNWKEEGERAEGRSYLKADVGQDSSVRGPRRHSISEKRTEERESAFYRDDVGPMPPRGLSFVKAVPFMIRVAGDTMGGKGRAAPSKSPIGRKVRGGKNFTHPDPAEGLTEGRLTLLGTFALLAKADKAFLSLPGRRPKEGEGNPGTKKTDKDESPSMIVEDNFS